MKTLAAHGLAGGIVQDRMGGSFGAGFLAGSLGSYFGSSGKSGNTNEMIINTAREAVIGGTISVVGGGKFANGAQTGAFRYLFNENTTHVDMDPILLRLLVGGDPTENCQMVYKCMKYMKDKGNNIDPINPLDVHTKVGVKFFKRFKSFFKLNVFGGAEYVVKGMYYKSKCQSLNYYSCRGKGIPLPLEAFE